MNQNFPSPSQKGTQVLPCSECQIKARSKELDQGTHKGKHKTQTILHVTSRMKDYFPQDCPSPSRNVQCDPDSGRQGFQNSRHYQAHVHIGPRRAIAATFKEVNVLLNTLK